MSNMSPDKGEGDSYSVLPQALAELIRRVVHKARLWPSERRELMAELESHFREGLIELAQNGESLEESIGVLRDGFGDPDLTARLIRRSKKRGRPMIWKIFATTVLVLVAAAAAGGGYLAYVSIGTPTPTVDYIAKINEPLQRIPESDRAWPILREALLQFRPFPAELEPTRQSLPRPGEEKWPAALAWVESNRPIVSKLKEAAQKPVLGYVYDNQQMLEFMRQRAAMTGKAFEEHAEDPMAPPTLGVLLPYLSELREVGRFLVLDARDQLTRGDFSAACQSLDIVHRLGAQLFARQTVIEQLVGTAMISTATDELRSLLYQSATALTAQDLSMIEASHFGTMPNCTLKGDFRRELFFFNDVVQYTFTDDGNGNGHLIPSQYARLVSYGEPATSGPEADDAGDLAIAAVHADRRETVAKYHELYDKMEEYYTLPLYDPRRSEAGRVADSIRTEATGQRFAVIHVMLVNFSRADEIIRNAAMNEQAARTLVAILRFQLDHGAAPQRLAELTPSYTAAIPVDAYSGMHLRYTADAKGFKLYSVGHNLQDDGGSSKKIRDAGEGRPMGPADIVYWPCAE